MFIINLDMCSDIKVVISTLYDYHDQLKFAYIWTHLHIYQFSCVFIEIPICWLVGDHGGGGAYIGITSANLFEQTQYEWAS